MLEYNSETTTTSPDLISIINKLIKFNIYIYIYMLNINNIIDLIIPVITSFPILISIITDLFEDITKYHPKFLFGFIKFIYDKILLKLEIKPENQLNALFFNYIIQFIQSLIFFTNINVFNKIFLKLKKQKFLPLNYKLLLLFQNIIVIIFIFFVDPKIDKYIN